MTDTLTVLRCGPGHRATKLICRGENGIEVTGYDAGTWFSVRLVPLDRLEPLAGVLDRISSDPRSFIIRGEPLSTIDRRQCRRLLHMQADGTPPTFAEIPKRWVLLDFDTLDEPRRWDWRDGSLSALFLRAMLPPEFHGVSFWWQFTGGAGFKPGLRMRLGFWLDRRISGDELGRWLASAPVDHAVFRPVQPIYVARPILRSLTDPVRFRSGLEWDFHDEVAVPVLPAAESRSASLMAAERRRRLLSLPAARHGWPFAVLEEAARAVAEAPPGGRNLWNGAGRHHGLYCAALRVSGLVRGRFLDRKRVEGVLAAAAQTAGIGNGREIARTIRNGFRRGGLEA
jgi:hypothetical protein